MADKKDSKGSSGGNPFLGFIGIIILLGFLVAFWNAFKAGNFTTNSANQQGDQTVNLPSLSQDYSSEPSGANYQPSGNGIIYYDQSGRPINNPNGSAYSAPNYPVPYPAYMAQPTQANAGNCGNVGGTWTGTECEIVGANQAACAAVNGTYYPVTPTAPQTCVVSWIR
ncbi:MAG: hypothetical protein KGH93_00715 [Patescibacteria group bacterium]|nr:hypothetical protein [Patescibacteria group bacterium]MDE1945707.1 hypothetical protein [Patescibacteria group bacterium]